jgi:predicted transcriptional regulator
MAPSDIDSLRKKSEELGQKLDELTDKMEERIAVQSQALDNTVPQKSFVNMASVGTSVLMSCAISKPCRPSCEFSLSLPSRPLNPPFVNIDSLRKKSEELGQQLDELTDKMEERIAVQSQALNNTVPQTQTANTIQTAVGGPLWLVVFGLFP